jgi:hypothetical protein
VLHELEDERIAARRAHADLQLDGAAFADRDVVLGAAALSDQQQAKRVNTPNNDDPSLLDEVAEEAA